MSLPVVWHLSLVPLVGEYLRTFLLSSSFAFFSFAVSLHSCIAYDLLILFIFKLIVRVLLHSVSIYPPSLSLSRKLSYQNHPPKYRIGAAIAQNFFNLSINLALTYSTNKAAIEELVSSLNSQQENQTTQKEMLRISIHKVDVGVVSDLERLFDEVKREHGGRVVDILVSNAGYGKRIVDIWFVNFLFLFHFLSILIPSLRSCYFTSQKVTLKSKQKIQDLHLTIYPIQFPPESKY